METVPIWLMSKTVFEILVWGGILGLSGMTIVILLIFAKEVKEKKIW